jgi:hypothetical protein
VVKIHNWPTIPNSLLVAEIRQWWRCQREGWARRVHGVYDTVGQGIIWPFRFARDTLLAGDSQSPLEHYRGQEWSAVLNGVEEIVDKLTWMSESGNQWLQPNIQRLLAGKSRVELLDRLREEHGQIALDQELKLVVTWEMEKFQQGSPELYKFYRQLNNLAAAVRPVTSVVLFTLGWGPAGQAVAPFVANAASQAVVHVVADLAGGAVAAVAGEQAVSGVAGRGAGFLQAKFHQLQTAFTAHRAGWLVGRLKELLLGTLPEELQAAAALPESNAFTQVSEVLTLLEKQLKVEHQETPA